MNISENDLLLVIDMQNVYLPENEWACPRMKECISYITDLLTSFPKNQIAFTSFMASKTPIGVWKKYNEINTDINDSVWRNDYVSELKPFLTKENFFTKSTYSCSGNKALMNKIKNYNNIYVTGVVAECCVLATVYDLIDLGKKVFYLKRGIAGECEEKENQVIHILESLSPLHIEFL